VKDEEMRILPKDEKIEDILTEVDFAGSILTNGCCLADKDIKNNEQFDSYKIGKLYLPKDFQHVPCTFDKDKHEVKISDVVAQYGNRRKMDILTPILMNLWKEGDEYPNPISKALHNCDNYRNNADGAFPEADKDYRDGGLDTIREGCLTMLKSLDNKNEYKVFYYSGFIHLPENQDSIQGEFYLIPLSLSDGTIVYYVIRKSVNGKNYNYMAQLNFMYDKLLEDHRYAGQIVAQSPMRYDDYLAVFLLSDIMFEALPDADDGP
jgi:hypothetical protein